jgi:hypothetical protein
MQTTSNKQDAINRTTALALHAVTRYALDHRLPAPQAIRRPRIGDRAVRVDLYVGEHDAWVDALDAEYLSTQTIGEARRSVAVKWGGQVPSPIGFVAVELRIVQHISDRYAGQTPQLALVPSGGVA